MGADRGDQFAGESNVVRFFEQNGNALGEPEDQTRVDGLGELDFDEVNGGATQTAGFGAWLGHAREHKPSRAER